MAKRLAKTKEDFIALTKSSVRGLVRTEEDWHALLKSKKSPLAKCGKQAVKKFTATLTFKNGGLAHANYTALMGELTLNEFVNLWKVLGISPELLALIDHHKCVQKGDCEYYFPAICTPNC